LLHVLPGMCNAVMMGDDLAFVKAAADEVFPEYNAKQMDFSSQNNSSEVCCLLT